MNNFRSRNVGVVDLRPGQLRFCLITPDNLVIASQKLRKFVGDHHDIGNLMTLALELREEIPGLDTLVLVTRADEKTLVGDPDQYQPRFLSGFPFPVYQLNHIVAGANSVPADWQGFQLVDTDSSTLWLLKKRKGRLVDMSLVPFSRLSGKLADQVNQCALFGFDHVAHLGESANASSEPLLPNEIELSSLELLIGAKRAYERHLGYDGSRLCFDRMGCREISLTMRKTVSCKITSVDRPVFSTDESTLCRIADGHKLLLVIDHNVNRLYGESIAKYSEAFLNIGGILILDTSESHKNAETVNHIYDAAVRVDFPRDGIFVGIGGGITLDLVGFAASTYRRGIGYLRIPTTLIGLIDVGVGVKQGYNSHGKKNLIGSFYPALAVINDYTFLRTLSMPEILCGMAEILKVAMVRDKTLFELMDDCGETLRDSRFLEPRQHADHVLFRSVMGMAQELQLNLYEDESQRLMDFGHTFSPMIETHSEYRIPHGYAVAMDICLSTAVAVVRGICLYEVFIRVAGLYQRLGLPALPPEFPIDKLAESLVLARHHRRGNLNLVVPSDIGKGTFLQEVTNAELREAIYLLSGSPGQNMRATYASACF
ncbi:MAG: hypothetical protein ABSD72_02235 [Terracidiphilus sp.]|jgi:3-dehydroquinate synthase